MTHMYFSARAEGRISYTAISAAQILVFVVLTFNIAIVFLNLYATVNCEI